MALTQVKTLGIADDAVTEAKVADNAINSEHYTDGSIDNAHIADDQIDSEHYVDGSIDLAHMSTNSVDSDQYVDGSIDLAHMSANSVDSDQYVDGSIDLAHMSANSVDSDQYVDGSIDNAHLADDAVGVAELSATGTASSSTYLRGDNTWATVAATLGGGTGVDFNDTVKVRFGTDNDLELYHDGSNAWISNTTGNLIIRDTTDTVYIQAPSIRFQDDTTNEDIAKFISDGACELYYDNVKKLETTSVGAHVWGNLQFVDTAKIQLGTLLDLEIYHDGTNSLIKNNTNILSLQGDDIRLLNNAASEAYLKAANNGAVQLFYDSSLKFETTSSGAQFTDNVKFDNPDTAGRDVIWEANNDALHWEDNTKAIFGGGNDLEIYHDSTHSYVDNTGTGNLYLRDTGTVKVRAATFGVDNHGGTETMMQMSADGAVDLYYDHSKKLETTSTGLWIHEDTDKVISFSGSIGEIGDVPGFQGSNTAGSAITSIGMRGTDIRFATGNSERVRITDAGLSIGGTGTLGTYSGYSNIWLGGTSHLYSEEAATTSRSLSISQNAHVDTDGSWEYIVTDEASNMYQSAGNIGFRCAPSGTAGNDISWETGLIINVNSGVELYYDNSKKLETTSAGGTLTGAWSGVGKVLQVVSTTKTDTTSFSIASDTVYHYTDTSLRVTITPTSGSNTLYITGVVNIGRELLNKVFVLIGKDGSTLAAANGDTAGDRFSCVANGQQGYTNNTLSMPFHIKIPAENTTERYYNLGFQHGSSSSRTVYLNRGSGDADGYGEPRTISTISVMEIGA